MNKEQNYKDALYNDLTYFLMNALLAEASNKKEMIGHILDTWATRNAKLIKYAFDEQAKKFAEAAEESDNDVGIDEITILLSTRQLVFDSVRKDLVKDLKTKVIESFGL